MSCEFRRLRRNENESHQPHHSDHDEYSAHRSTVISVVVKWIYVSHMGQCVRSLKHSEVIGTISRLPLWITIDVWTAPSGHIGSLEGEHDDRALENFSLMMIWVSAVCCAVGRVAHAVYPDDLGKYGVDSTVIYCNASAYGVMRIVDGYSGIQ